MRKLIIKMLAIIAITFSSGSCFDGPWTDIRDVQFREQLTYNYCAVACIQMWAIFDGADDSQITQDFIADNTHFGQYGDGLIPEDIASGVDMFTNSNGYLLQSPSNNIGQDECIAACIASIKDFRLAIVPFYRGLHTVLAIGYKWHYENGKRIADKMFYHDPAVGPSIDINAIDLKVNRFKPLYTPPCYWVVVGRSKNYSDGQLGYREFLAGKGTFYGGPSVYNPYTFDPKEPVPTKD